MSSVAPSELLYIVISGTQTDRRLGYADRDNIEQCMQAHIVTYVETGCEGDTDYQTLGRCQEQ